MVRTLAIWDSDKSCADCDPIFILSDTIASSIKIIAEELSRSKTGEINLYFTGHSLSVYNSTSASMLFTNLILCLATHSKRYCDR